MALERAARIFFVHYGNGWGTEDQGSAATSAGQQEALAVLAEVWALAPDVRLGQLMAHLGFLGEAHIGKGLGYIDDDELIAILHRHRAELRARLESMPDDMQQSKEQKENG
jgi:hypothetical protein